MKNANKVVMLSIVSLVCLIISGGFLIYSIVNNTQKNVAGKVDSSNNNLFGDEHNGFYNLDNIKNVVIEVPKANADGPVIETKTITNIDEIKSVLTNIDSAVLVKKIDDGVGFTGNTTITINYNGDPSTKIIILDNGNIAMNLAVGAGESGYAEYSINNKKLKTELISKYQSKVTYYDFNNIKNVVIEVPKANADGPAIETKTITNIDEIKSVLTNIDSAVLVKKIADGVGFTGNTTITINYNGNPSTKIIILDNGNIAMNLAVGAGESGYAEYSINNKKLKTELISKYQGK